VEPAVFVAFTITRNQNEVSWLVGVYESSVASAITAQLAGFALAATPSLPQRNHAYVVVMSAG
jgi:hypothetical protein